MGPFVPDLISNELNLIFAFFIGLAFGYVLEQAGFSSSRKLTGLFYGTDFTVLRVFFTAGITAMSGIILLGYFGLLDLRVIFVNPTFLYSALVGGGIMGGGFVVGGYCPGTSFCGAAIGKIDAMIFVAGGFIGALVFGEMYPLIRELYMAGAFGELTVDDVLGVSPGMFSLAMTATAIAAFMATSLVERRNNSAAPVHAFRTRRHRIAAAGLLVVGIAVAMLPDRESSLLERAVDPEYRSEHPVARMSVDELAFRVIDGDPLIRVVDVRPAEQFASMTLPGAINVQIQDMFGKEWRDVLSETRRKKVIVATTNEDALVAATLLDVIGYENLAVLQGGWTEFADTILHAVRPRRPMTSAEEDIYRFRLRAAPQLLAMLADQSAPKPTERRVKKVQAGCGM